MGHVYLQTIAVTVSATANGAAAGEMRPERLVWRGREYRVAEVLSTWRLRDLWWEELPPLSDALLPGEQPQPGPGQGHRQGRRLGGASWGASERTYWRVRCEGYGGGVEGLICDVYEDAAREVWVLDTVYD
ncbi:MAG: hypothetical protein OJF49_004778 [Ktedonobacterales bacterium]|jgi:hypothetical protein|nr:MAG: hypothetical protein OJF49_004778 [Ktedonobacterales bacterium]